MIIEGNKIEAERTTYVLQIFDHSSRLSHVFFVPVWLRTVLYRKSAQCLTISFILDIAHMGPNASIYYGDQYHHEIRSVFSL